MDSVEKSKEPDHEIENSNEDLSEEDAIESYWKDLFVNQFHSASDEAIVLLAQSGDSLAEEFLLNKYKNFVRSRARSYFLIGADHEDIVQEGMIGLFKAIRDYQPEKLSSFKVFAELCVTRQILTAIKSATRMKHAPLNAYVSLNKPLTEDDSERTMLDILSVNRNQNPEELILGQDNVLLIQEKAKTILSPLEQRVLADYMNGINYQEIARKLNRSPKSIDNALQRVRKKMESFISESKQKDE